MSDQPAAQSPARYHSAAILLHWLLALLLAYQFALGLRLDAPAAAAEKFTAYQLHKSVGILILLASLARLGVRLTKPRPAELEAGWRGLAARAVHGLFYAVMIGGPLTGWAVVSTAKIKIPTVLFGVLPWPNLPLGRGAGDAAELGHAVLVWLLPALVALHVAGVLYHLAKRDEVPGRMFGSAAPLALSIAGALALLVACVATGLAGPLAHLWGAGPSGSAPAALAPPAAPSDAATSEPADAEAAMTAPTDEPAASEQAAAPLGADWAVQSGSTLGFSTAYSGTAISGSFRRWDAQIHFAEDDLAHARIAATIQTGSAQSGDSERDETMKGADLLDVAGFPVARFSATGFQRLAPGRYAANGTLSLHGVSRPVRLVFTLKVDGDAALAQGSTTLSRLGFGVGGGDWAATDQVPDNVAIHFTIKARRKP
jgi:cytochrome b561/polyisoprenoid-binding protein YceI